MSKYLIYVDMDSTLVDFDTKFIRLTGIQPDDFIEINGRPEFWRIVQSVENYWKNLDWMPDGKKLWNYIKKYHPILLTKPAPDQCVPTCKQDKIEWVEKNIGKDVSIIFSTFKEFYAKHGTILIDDKIKNIDKWNEAGGIGILHRNAKETIQKLKEYHL